MPYNEELQLRIRSCLNLFPKEVHSAIEEKKMFGGIAFLYSGKMTVGIIKEQLVVRVISDKIEEVFKMKHVKPMDFTKKPIKEFIYVDPPGFKDESQLHYWISLGIEHAHEKLRKSQ